jgi:hypothetical protein
MACQQPVRCVRHVTACQRASQAAPLRALATRVGAAHATATGAGNASVRGGTLRPTGSTELSLLGPVRRLLACWCKELARRATGFAGQARLEMRPFTAPSFGVRRPTALMRCGCPARCPQHGQGQLRDGRNAHRLRPYGSEELHTRPGRRGGQRAAFGGRRHHGQEQHAGGQPGRPGRQPRVRPLITPVGQGPYVGRVRRRRGRPTSPACTGTSRQGDRSPSSDMFPTARGRDGGQRSTWPAAAHRSATHVTSSRSCRRWSGRRTTTSASPTHSHLRARPDSLISGSQYGVRIRRAPSTTTWRKPWRRRSVLRAAGAKVVMQPTSRHYRQGFMLSVVHREPVVGALGVRVPAVSVRKGGLGPGADSDPDGRVVLGVAGSEAAVWQNLVDRGGVAPGQRDIDGAGGPAGRR